MKMTSTSLIHVINENENIQIEPLRVVYKDGGDGSGPQTV